jgi:type IV secretory pathway TrbL component
MSDNHGNTPAAWTAVVVALAGFVVGGIGLMIDSWVTFWIGVVMVPLALVVLGALTKMGYGTSRH